MAEEEPTLAPHGGGADCVLHQVVPFPKLLLQPMVGRVIVEARRHDVHGPFLSPTGRLVWAHARKPHEVRDRSGKLVSEGRAARIWWSRLDGSDVHVFAGGGMDNPTGLTFTEEGELLGTVPLFYSGPRGDTVTHWVHGGVYPRYDREHELAEFKRTGDLLSHVVQLGHTAPAGITRYRSGEFGKAFLPPWTGTGKTACWSTPSSTP